MGIARELLAHPLDPVRLDRQRGPAHGDVAFLRTQPRLPGVDGDGEIFTRIGQPMSAAEADDLPHLHRFVRSLRRDFDAVLNGLTLPHNSGAAEG